MAARCAVAIDARRLIAMLGGALFIVESQAGRLIGFLACAIVDDSTTGQRIVNVVSRWLEPAVWSPALERDLLTSVEGFALGVGASVILEPATGYRHELSQPVGVSPPDLQRDFKWFVSAEGTA